MWARCAQHAIEVLGIDAFRVEGDRIQPLMEHSIDFSLSSPPAGRRNGCHDEAIKFLLGRGGSDIWFEVVVDK